MASPRGKRTTVATLVLLVGVAGAVTSCSNSASTSESSPPVSISANADHNTADVQFLTEMIPHHQQALVMAEMVPSHTNNPELIKLANQIAAAQGPEIDQMNNLLSQWGQPTVNPSATGSMDHGMSGGGHGDMADGTMGPGMMSAEDMASLDGMNGASFDQIWLTMMIAHHEGAIEMSQQELADGKNPQAKKLAQTIITGQTAEIATMKQMLEQ